LKQNVEGSDHGLSLRYYPDIFCTEEEFPEKISERIDALQAQI
jgi:hypothetical protein